MKRRRASRIRLLVVGALTIVGSLPVSAGIAPTPAAAQTSPVITDSGCNANLLPPNDDGSTAAVTLPFSINFFGDIYNQVFVNNNGNITFASALSTYTPFTLGANTPPIIAPFFGDVDTTSANAEAVPGASPPVSNPMRYGVIDDAAAFGGRDVFCVNWRDVGYYSNHADKLNDFQLLLVDRGDRAPGDFDVYFNYNRITWETGDASGGSGGLGGTSAGAGFSSGTGDAAGFFELGCSLINGACLDSNTSTGLRNTSTTPAGVTPMLGRHIFVIRQGFVEEQSPPVFEAPTPADGTPLHVDPGTPVTFDVAASDPDPTDIVSLSIIGLPSGSTFAPTAGNPATGTFAWTPTTGGNTILTLLAQNQAGLGAVQRSVTISVPFDPWFTLPTPVDGALVTFPATRGLALDVTARHADPSKTVRLGVFDLPAGASYSYVGFPGNTSHAILRWTPAIAADTVVVLTAFDGDGRVAPTRAVTLRALHSLTELRANAAVAKAVPRPPSIGTGGIVVYDVYLPYVAATLTDTEKAATPKPVKDRTVRFVAGSETICTAKTRADGVAVCQGAVVTTQLAVLLADGYRAIFDGDATYASSSTTAPLVEGPQ